MRRGGIHSRRRVPPLKGELYALRVETRSPARNGLVSLANRNRIRDRIASSSRRTSSRCLNNSRVNPCARVAARAINLHAKCSLRYSPSLPPLSFCTFFVSCATLPTASPLPSSSARARPLAPGRTPCLFSFSKRHGTSLMGFPCNRILLLLLDNI